MVKSLGKLGNAVDILKKVSSKYDFSIFKYKTSNFTLSNALEIIGIVLLVIPCLI